MKSNIAPFFFLQIFFQNISDSPHKKHKKHKKHRHKVNPAELEGSEEDEEVDIMQSSPSLKPAIKLKLKIGGQTLGTKRLKTFPFSHPYPVYSHALMCSFFCFHWAVWSIIISGLTLWMKAQTAQLLGPLANQILLYGKVQISSTSSPLWLLHD